MLNNFFTFDLSSLRLDGLEVVSAVLEIQRYGYSSPDRREDYQLFDVDTDPMTLNTQNGRSAEIHRDLGTGVSYGMLTLGRGPQKGLERVALADAALRDIEAAAGGYFSIGGTLIRVDLTNTNQTEAAFTGSHNVLGADTQRLIVVVAAGG